MKYCAHSLHNIKFSILFAMLDKRTRCSYLIMRISLLFIIICLDIAVVGLGECYFFRSNYAYGNFFCEPFAYTLGYCPQGWTCLSNQLCVITDPDFSSSKQLIGTTIRGTCTNPQWNTTACGNFCLGMACSSLFCDLLLLSSMEYSD